MRPNDSPRFDEDTPTSRSGPMTAATILNWGTCRTEMSIIMVAGIFLTLGIGILLYLRYAMGNPAGGMGADPGLAVALVPPMLLFLYLGIVMVVVTLFVGGAPSEAGASGWSLGTRVSFLALLLSVEGFIFLLESRDLNESTSKLFVYLFGGELALVVIFWSLYQRSVALHVGSAAAAGAAIPFLILGVACVGANVFAVLEADGMFALGRRHGGQDGQTFALISTAAQAALALYQAFLAGAIRGGINRFVTRNAGR